MLKYAGLILCSVIQSIIRSIIASVFLFRFLLWMEYTRAAKYWFVAYLTALLVFDIFIAFDIFFDDGIGISCDNSTSDW